MSTAHAAYTEAAELAQDVATQARRSSYPSEPVYVRVERVEGLVKVLKGRAEEARTNGGTS